MVVDEDVVHVGFTGTQAGMTIMQATTLTNAVAQFPRFVGHHGWCIGADEQFDGIARAALGFDHMQMYPMVFAGTKRGRCVVGPRDVVHPEKPPLVRNEDIARVCKVLIATPKEDHMVLRSGTWTTVRRALGFGKPVFVIVPNGAIIPWR